MAIPSYKTRVVLGDFNFSCYVTDLTAPLEVAMLDVTTLCDTARQFIPGQNTSTLSLKGYLDPDGTSNGQYDQLNTWTGNEAVSFGMSGLAFGSELRMVNGLQSASSTGATTSSPVSFSVDVQTAIHTDRGVSLHDLTAETTDGSSAAYDGGASSTNGGVAHLHVTAFSGLTSNVVIVEDSATGSSGWATIGTFATATGLTSERLTITGTIRRYVRCSWDVTGTGSTTFLVGIARR